MGNLNEIRKFYWAISRLFSLVGHLSHKGNESFRREVLKSYIRRYITGIPPQKNFDLSSADRAASWLLKAQGATPDGGVSQGYFLKGPHMEWRQSYPETTGYIIPSLLEYALLKQDDAIRKCAVAMADWEISIQMPTGAVQGGTLTTPDKQKPAIFNTGMVLQGWTAAYRTTGEEKYLEAGRKAADFLETDMDEKGHYRTHGGFVTTDKIKTYNVLCSWALYRFGEDSRKDEYKKAALKNGAATLEMQQGNGWFKSCCLTHPEKPLTHTLGYTMQGLFELGVLADRSDFISAVEKCAQQLIRNIQPNGYLAGRFDRNWKSKAAYSCLTGSAQIAIVLYRLAEVLGKSEYIEAADRLVDFLKALQLCDGPDPDMNGAIAGSFPLLGGYMTAGYPNWSTKYFLDAVLLQKNLRET